MIIEIETKQSDLDNIDRLLSGAWSATNMVYNALSHQFGYQNAYAVEVERIRNILAELRRDVFDELK